MRTPFVITSLVAAVLAAGMCAAWPAPPHDATKATPSSAPPPVQPESASERRWQAAETQHDMNAAASADETEARARMERALKEVRDHASTLGAQASTVLALVDRSQRAWKAYFDAEVELRWPPNAGDFGSVYPMCVASDIARMSVTPSGLTQRNTTSISIDKTPSFMTSMTMAELRDAGSALSNIRVVKNASTLKLPPPRTRPASTADQCPLVPIGAA